MTAEGKRVLLIDNYDSFTWNLYQYLCEEGARVEVYRNDEITLDEIEIKNPDQILISPGPGHPTTDSGISIPMINRFKGKIPIFGICMGEQCIFETFGGKVSFAGEIVHGKTSPINHDNKGMFKNIPQGVVVTRYHSLAGTRTTLPDELEVTATTDNGIIMGVRHKKYTVEGVQFHPESILTEEGHLMIRNMLSIEGGEWNNDNLSKSSDTTQLKKESILDKIYAQRRLDVLKLSSTPGFTFEDLQTNYELGLAPKQISFYDRLQSTISDNNKSLILAEIKRASPSKGDIDIKANAAKQLYVYATSGASLISVLTEPTWFKGSIQDLSNARRIVDTVPNRPAILRKEFVFCEYQILELRLAGADTVLLIVKMFDLPLLQKLYDYSKKLGMEPLVEVNAPEELKLALAVGAKVIGVNNRNLNDFNVDLNTTSDISSLLPKDGDEGKPIILCALSGISSVKDVATYKTQNVHGFLIGEALMKKGEQVGTFIQELVNA